MAKRGVKRKKLDKRENKKTESSIICRSSNLFGSRTFPCRTRTLLYNTLQSLPSCAAPQHQRSRCALANWIPNLLWHSGASPHGDSFEGLDNKPPRACWIRRVICGHGCQRRGESKHWELHEILNKFIFIVIQWGNTHRQDADLVWSAKPSLYCASLRIQGYLRLPTALEKEKIQYLSMIIRLIHV